MNEIDLIVHDRDAARLYFIEIKSGNTPKPEGAEKLTKTAVLIRPSITSTTGGIVPLIVYQGEITGQYSATYFSLLPYVVDACRSQ